MSDCIEWTGYKNAKGYGERTVKGVHCKAHRFAWEQANGPIPAGLLVCHHCDNPSCVNVDHMFLGTNSDNSKDKVSKGRQARLKGENCGMSKLTDESAVFSMARILSGESQSSVSREMGVTQAAMSCLWFGKTWGHLFVDGGIG